MIAAFVLLSLSEWTLYSFSIVMGAWLGGLVWFGAIGGWAFMKLLD